MQRLSCRYGAYIKLSICFGVLERAEHILQRNGIARRMIPLGFALAFALLYWLSFMVMTMIPRYTAQIYKILSHLSGFHKVRPSRPSSTIGCALILQASLQASNHPPRTQFFECTRSDRLQVDACNCSCRCCRFRSGPGLRPCLQGGAIGAGCRAGAYLLAVDFENGLAGTREMGLLTVFLFSRDGLFCGG